MKKNHTTFVERKQGTFDVYPEGQDISSETIPADYLPYRLSTLHLQGKHATVIDVAGMSTEHLSDRLRARKTGKSPALAAKYGGKASEHGNQWSAANIMKLFEAGLPDVDVLA